MANTYLYRTQVAGTSTQKMTFSAWVKRSELGSYTGLLNCYQSDASRNAIYFQPADTLAVYFKTSGSTHIYYETNRKFRDINAWYHIVVRIDTTQGNASHRCRIYINGEEETSFSNSSGGSQNASFSCINQNNLDLEVGRMQYGSTVTAYYTGSMSHVHFLDGEDRTPDYFGSTDSTTGEWKINTNPTGINYGNNGFFILKDDNSNLDRSGEGHNQTIGGTLTKTEDNPSNVFNTLNPLDGYQSNYTYAQGNTAVASTSGSRTYVTSTLAMPSGKYYWECKLDATIGDSGGASTSVYVGITGQSPISPSQFPSDGTCFNCVMNTNGQVYSNGSTIGSAMGSSWATSTFVMMAYDADNNKMYFGKDGVWLNSGDPTSGATGTGAFTPTTAASATPIGVYMPQWGVDFNASYGTSFNFGNGYFGTTAVASAGTNASGIGIFEYDVPTGYTALSTKGLNL